MAGYERNAKSGSILKSLLEELGLQQFYSNKLSLSEVLQIDQRTVSDDSTQNLSDVSWIFLKKLMLVNVTARNVKCDSSPQTDSVEDLDLLDLYEDSSSAVNPLDIITALFLCSDSFLQQELTYKMSLCQFSVPFILPDCEKQQNILMLWALRDIVKKFRPHSLSDSKGFVEERMVQFDLPLFSFVRFGDCSIFKSQILNLMLSNPQQNHNTFIHRNMDCGNIQRRISDGLVEISWYLPCGNKNIDIFPEALAVTNLRGDIRDFEAQFSFLCHVSTAVFIFCDNLNSESQFLSKTHGQAQMFLVCDVQTKDFNMDLLKKTASEMNLKKNNIILKNRHQNESDFVNRICSAVKDVITNNPVTVQLEKMSDVAHELGLLIDEENTECKLAKDRVYEITRKIKKTYEFKKEQLPLQGELWKKLSKLEKEECRLREAGAKNIEMYKSELEGKKKKLREQQSSYKMSETITLFIAALTYSPLERYYFLKWMRMNLDDLSRKHLSALREEYKMKCESSENKKEIKELDERISNSSLGTEHFLRELGQWYEAAVSLPENPEQRKQMEVLPRLCAQLLLDGFPLELLDGDASNIPLRWVSDVLKELNTLVEGRNKIRVVTVLGVQSTGKSTFLNTMFGVQFAVSSGRCTRGAFMLLIKVSDNYREDLNCDYLMIIDTEGLKSAELSQLDDSYEHDNELATLVVGLSDITIINISMENSTEMKDILQIVVHAFLRMKEVGEKPECVFVHQNVADVSAHEKNMRDRKILLEQLDEMTKAAAKMENKDEYKKFTDVINYDQKSGNWYIPGLWHGNPPMAPVNSGYSESVYDFKKNMMGLLMKYKNTQKNNILDFLEWTKSLWRSVKYENFIFSFRNSLVADAYIRLCTEFNKWEWTLKKSMYTWLTEAETKISNFEILKTKSDKSNLQDLLQTLRIEAKEKLDKEEKTMLDHLCKYFKQTEGHVNLVEKYREDFKHSITSLRKETERSVLNKLETVTEIRTANNKLDNIKKTYTDKMEQKVRELLNDIRKNPGSESLSEEELTKVFEDMWKKTIQDLSFEGLKKKNIYDSVFKKLRENLENKGSSVSETLNSANLHEFGRERFTVKDDHIVKGVKDYIFFFWSPKKKLQELSDSIIRSCNQSVEEKVMKKADYHENYIQEILQIIDEKLNSGRNLKFKNEYELSLKLHICGISVIQFQNMHDRFNEENDPYRCLEKFKNQYCSDFKDLFHNRDQCQKKAEEFTQFCLKPAVENFIYSRLGPDIVDVMLQGDEGFQFSTRTFFQFSILQELLKEETFQDYVRYINFYEEFVKKWILNQVFVIFSTGNKLFKIEGLHLRKVVTEITEVIKETQKTQKTESIKGFIDALCTELRKTLIIQRDALEAVMALSNANQEQFADCLIQSVQEMADSLKVQFKEEDIQNKLSKLSVKPQDVLFKRVFGCGKLCPFCKVPCEAGGAGHQKHFASVHRPQGLGEYKWGDTKKLTVDICSTLVQSESSFSCQETNYEYHPYKDYRKFFPDWDIQPDPSIEASDYWKYVLMKFNHQFAEEYKAEPADIPPAWENITKEQAEKSLKEIFRCNENPAK